MAVQNNNNGNEVADESPQLVPSDKSQEAEQKQNKFPGFNLYVKNLDDSFTDASLREAFDSFGTITSAKVMCDSTGKSKGFGFVCFETQEEANRALQKMNGRIVGMKPLYVAMAQKKEERKQFLSHKYKNLSLNSNAPAYTPLPAVPGPPIQTQCEPAQVPPHPANNYITGPPVQFRYIPNDSIPWHCSIPGPYITPPSVGPAITYLPVPYQPVLVVPGVGMMPPPLQQVPVLHQPVYLHSSKTNTLIYSTGPQAVLPQAPSPGSYSSSQNVSESARLAITSHQNSISPVFKGAPKGMLHSDIQSPVSPNSGLEQSSVSANSQFH